MDRPIERDIIEEASISYEAEKEEHEKDLGDVERIDEVYGKLDANSPKCVSLSSSSLPRLTSLLPLF